MRGAYVTTLATDPQVNLLPALLTSPPLQYTLVLLHALPQNKRAFDTLVSGMRSLYILCAGNKVMIGVEARTVTLE